MSNPQGPGRHPDDDTDASERTGELPVWGAPPAGGWGAAGGRDGLEQTGAWSPEQDDRAGGAGRGWSDQGAADGGWAPRTARHDAGDAAPLWGDETPPDQGDSWAVPTGRRGGRRRAPEEPTDAVPADSPASGWPSEQPTAAHPGDGGGAGGWAPVEQGDEPWAPREAVRTPLDRTKWGLIGGGVLLVAVVLVTALLWPGWAVTTYLDQTALQTGVNQVLTQDYGLTVGAVQCPGDVEVSAGTQFSCQAVVDGEQVEVPGVVTSDEGDYQINRV